MPVKSFSLPSFAKINWILRIIGKRADGYHELCTVFQTVSLADEIEFCESDRLALSCNRANLSVGEDNLIIRAGRILQERFGVKNGARIKLVKNIPFPGGLGGGSSNAAVALIGLAKLWNLELKASEFALIAAELGSDVPFFLVGGTAIGKGRGTEIIPFEDVAEKHLLIVTPDVGVPTRKAFDLMDVSRLTNLDSKSILQICRYEALALKLRQFGFENDFESAVFREEPEIERVKKKLFDSGAKHALMSGSGSSVFAVFENKVKLQVACDVLKTEESWRVEKVRTISRSEYSVSLGLIDSLLY